MYNILCIGGILVRLPLEPFIFNFCESLVVCIFLIDRLLELSAKKLQKWNLGIFPFLLLYISHLYFVRPNDLKCTEKMASQSSFTCSWTLQVFTLKCTSLDLKSRFLRDKKNSCYRYNTLNNFFSISYIKLA